MKNLVWVLLLLMASILVRSTSGMSDVKSLALKLETIVQKYPNGTTYSEFKKYLDENNLKYFIETKDELKLRKSPDFDKSISFILAFVVNRSKSEVEGLVVESMDLIDVKFDEDSRIVEYVFKKAYR